MHAPTAISLGGACCARLFRQLTASISWCVRSVTASSCVNRTNWGGLPWLPSGEVSEASMAAAEGAAVRGHHELRVALLGCKMM